MKWPRVLVISPIKFNQLAGGGVTMGNLFRGWPLDAIAQIHTDPTFEADYSVCKNYFHLPASPIRFSFQPLVMGSSALQIFNFAIGRQETLGHWVRMENVLRWSLQFAPDIIYTRPIDEPPFYWWLPKKLAQVLGIPYVTHVMDDWLARYEKRQGLMNYLLRKHFMRQSLQSLFNGAAMNMGISVIISCLHALYRLPVKCGSLPVKIWNLLLTWKESPA